MRPLCYVLDGHEAVACDDDHARWVRSQCDFAGHRVGETFVGEVRVSTVFLGFDAGAPVSEHPMLFETMIFRGPLHGKGKRYSTWDEAERGHAAFVALVMGGTMEAGVS